MKKLFLSLLILICAPKSFAADAPSWIFLPEKSSINFEVVVSGSPVKGKFEKFTCDIKFDHENLDGSSVKCSIDTSSINTSYKDRDDMLKNSQWFNVSAIPNASFESTKFTKTTDGKFQVEGNLKIKNMEQKINFPFDLIILRNKEGAEIAKVDAKTGLKRLLFNIGEGEWKNPSQVADDVNVTISVQAIKKKQ